MDIFKKSELMNFRISKLVNFNEFSRLVWKIKNRNIAGSLSKKFKLTYMPECMFYLNKHRNQIIILKYNRMIEITKNKRNLNSSN